MKLIVGLGNPLPRYQKTRHNVGRLVIEALAKKAGVTFKSDKSLKSQYADVGVRRASALHTNFSFLIAHPELFMNQSGEAVRLLVRHFPIDFQSDLLIVLDDAALPFGKLRLRAQGSDGGHKGLKSVEEKLGSRNYARLRIGIAPSNTVDETLEEYVLKPFSREEENSIPEILQRAVECCLLWLKSPIGKAMDWTNKPFSP